MYRKNDSEKTPHKTCCSVFLMPLLEQVSIQRTNQKALAKRQRREKQPPEEILMLQTLCRHCAGPMKTRLMKASTKRCSMGRGKKKARPLLLIARESFSSLDESASTLPQAITIGPMLLSEREEASREIIRFIESRQCKKILLAT